MVQLLPIILWRRRLLLLWLAWLRQMVAFGTCLDDDPSVVKPSRNVKLRLLLHSWQSHRLVAYVAAILLRDNMKYVVETVPSEETPMKDPELLARNAFDANFEFWPEGKEAQITTWIKNGSAKDYGVHHAISRSGMYVPKYLNSGIGDVNVYNYHKLRDGAVWSGNRTMSHAEGEEEGDREHECFKATWNCNNYTWKPTYCKSARVCNVQLWKGLLEYDQGLLEQQIKNNNLNIQVVYTSQETQERAVWDAYMKAEPVLFYSYEPRPAMLGITQGEFVHVVFPPASGCLKKSLGEIGDPIGNLSCDLGFNSLHKVVSPNYALEADATVFAKRFSLKQGHFDSLFLMRELADDAENPDWFAACMFVRENTLLWTPWVRYTARVNIGWDNECWPTFCWQGIACLCVAFMYVLPFSVNSSTSSAWRRVNNIRKQNINFDTKEGTYRFRQRCESQEDVEDGERPIDARIATHGIYGTGSLRNQRRGSTQESLQGKSWIEAIDTRADRHPSINTRPTFIMSMFLQKFLSSDSARVKAALIKNNLEFLDYRRSLLNFTLRNGHPDLKPPPRCSTPMRGGLGTKTDFLYYLITSCIKDVVVISTALGMLGGCWGTMCHMIKENLQINQMIDPNALEEWITLSDSVMKVVSNFSFLPIFLLSFFVNRESARWVGFIDLAYAVWGRVEDLALILAGAVEGINDENLKIQQRTHLFTAYRYINAVHYLTYYGVDVRMGSSPDEVLCDLVHCGLLEKAEGEILLSTPNKMKQVVLCWLWCLWTKMLRNGAVTDSSTNMFSEKLTALRGASILHLEEDPNLMKVMMKIVTILLTLFTMIADPWALQTSNRCFQPLAFVASFLHIFCYVGLLKLMSALQKSPYIAHGDCINVDWILCEVELMTFRCMRAGFAGTVETAPTLLQRVSRTEASFEHGKEEVVAAVPNTSVTAQSSCLSGPSMFDEVVSMELRPVSESVSALEQQGKDDIESMSDPALMKSSSCLSTSVNSVDAGPALSQRFSEAEEAVEQKNDMKFSQQNDWIELSV